MHIIVIISLYILSVYLNWKYTHIAYHPKKGRYTNSIITDHDLSVEMVLSFMPVFNTIGAVRWIIDWPYKKPLFTISARNFFKIGD